MSLLIVFAAAALVLATTGAYGLVSYLASQRAREIGVRVALGARPASIQKLVIVRGVTLGTVGLGIGIVTAAALSHLLSGMLFHVRAIDPLTYAGMSLLLGLVTVFACYWPARRASRRDPMVVLREE